MCLFMKYFNKKIEDVFKDLNTSYDGLSNEEAFLRLKENGLNVLTEKKKKSPIKRFLEQFNNAMIILLLIVGVLSFIYSTITHSDYTDAIVILFSVIVNAIMGYVQEMKAENSLESLKKHVTTNIEVIRNNDSIEIDSKELVKGDIIILKLVK